MEQALENATRSRGRQWVDRAAQAPRLARRSATVAASAAGHLLVLLALLSARTADPPKVFDLEPMTVSLVDRPRPTPSPAPAARARPSPAEAPSKRHVTRSAQTVPDIDPAPPGETPTWGSAAALSEAELAGATAAGSSAAGRGCDVARWLEAGLRKDPEVQAALARAPSAAGLAGGAVRVWNGDWIRHPSQDGAGLAVIREAIMMEILSAPAACRAEPMHGLFLISPNEAAGSLRFAVGSGEWRWADLLLPRRAGVTTSWR